MESKPTPEAASRLSDRLGAGHDSEDYTCPELHRTCGQMHNALLLGDEVDRLEAKLEALRPYIRHHSRCYKGGNDNATVVDCMCGLDAILSA